MRREKILTVREAVYGSLAMFLFGAWVCGLAAVSEANLAAVIAEREAARAWIVVGERVIAEARGKAYFGDCWNAPPSAECPVGGAR